MRSESATDLGSVSDAFACCASGVMCRGDLVESRYIGKYGWVKGQSWGIKRTLSSTSVQSRFVSFFFVIVVMSTQFCPKIVGTLAQQNNEDQMVGVDSFVGLL